MDRIMLKVKAGESIFAYLERVLRIRGLVIVPIALLLGGCAMHEGERYLVAGLVEVEGMMWRVKCGETTQRTLNARQIKELQRVASDDVQQHKYTEISRGRVAVQRDHYWASRERDACQH